MSNAPTTGPPAAVSPVPDAVSLPFWEAANRGVLVVQECESCGHLQYPPEGVCQACLGDRLAFRNTSGRGWVYSFIVVRQALDIPFRGLVPYVVAWIKLDEFPEIRMLANIEGVDPEEVHAGQPVEVFFEQRGAWSLPQFRPTVGESV